jgi:hypothetical protein
MLLRDPRHILSNTHLGTPNDFGDILKGNE